MKKNLKKVISAVIALALSLSTVATVSFAAGYTDVASTASYAEAVDVLSALGIIEGYEDGTFGPDKTIKRSEAAKIIVGMVNKLETAEGRMGATEFTDVPADHWASGYINVGVSDKFINGIGGGLFRPEGEVTYNQVVKMIVSCLGYEEYAQFYGGYPTGYVSIADSEGITKGCSMDGNSPATRAIVAQLVYNALKTPIIQSKGMQYSATAGGFVPNIEKQDGEESKYYKTLLTEKFEAYLVEGSVIDTSKTDTALNANEVEFDIQKSEKYDNTDIIDVDKNETYTLQRVKVGNTNAADYINTYAITILQIDDNDEYTMLTFVPSSKNRTVTLDAGLFDEDEYTEDNVFDSDGDIKSGAYLRYYASEDATRSTKYELDPKVTLYVNGVKLDSTKDNIDKYVINNTVGKVELVDVYASGASADGKYDFMYVEYYGTAIVDAVSSTRLTFADQVNVGRSSLTLDKEDNEDLVYHIYYNDEEIALTDIKKDDVLSIAYDVTASNASESLFFEIYVSRDTAEGKYDGQDNEEELISVAGTEYGFVKDYTEMTGSLAMGSEYTFYLDRFGRIFKYEILASSAKLAIIDRYYSSNSYDNMVGQFYFGDGTQKIIEVDAARVGMDESEIEALVYYNGSGKNTEKTPIENRVVEYKISSSTNKIISMDFLNPIDADDTKADYEEPSTSEYRARTNAIGGVKMNDATKIINATQYYTEWQKGNTASYSDLSIASLSSFADGVGYAAFGFGTKNSDGTFPFVVVTIGEGAYTEDTRFAVATKSLNTKTNDAGDEGYLLTALYDGTVQEFFVSDDAIVNGRAITDSYSGLIEKGDVVVFQYGTSNNIDTIDTIFSASSIALGDDYDTTVSKSLTPKFGDLISLPTDAKYWTKAWDPTNSDLTTSLVYGVITDKQEGYFQLAQVADGTIGDYEGLYTALDVEAARGDGIDSSTNGGYIDISITGDTKVYAFDYSVSRKDDQLYAGVPSDIIRTSIPTSQILTVDGLEYIPWEKTIDGEKVMSSNQIYFAFAKVVDGDATDVFVIKAE